MTAGDYPNTRVNDQTDARPTVTTRSANTVWTPARSLTFLLRPQAAIQNPNRDGVLIGTGIRCVHDPRYQYDDVAAAPCIGRSLSRRKCT